MYYHSFYFKYIRHYTIIYGIVCMEYPFFSTCKEYQDTAKYIMHSTIFEYWPVSQLKRLCWTCWFVSWNKYILHLKAGLFANCAYRKVGISRALHENSCWSFCSLGHVFIGNLWASIYTKKPSIRHQTPRSPQCGSLWQAYILMTVYFMSSTFLCLH